MKTIGAYSSTRNENRRRVKPETREVRGRASLMRRDKASTDKQSIGMRGGAARRKAQSGAKRHLAAAAANAYPNNKPRVKANA